MATHIYRRGNVFKRSGVAIQAGSSYTVTAYQPGAQVEIDAGGGTINVRVGHCFTAGDKFIVGTTATAVRTVLSVTATTVVYDTAPGSVTVAKGDLLVNLGPDTGTTSQPNWDGSTKKIYTDYDAVDVIAESRVSTNADGEYEYWYSGGDVWDVCRSSSTVVEQIEIVGPVGEPSVRYANAWATAGKGTAASPWTGFQGVVASNCLIRFPAGYYDMGATAFDISSSYSNVTIEGDGEGTVFVSDDGVHAFGAAGVGIEGTDVTLRNFRIDGESDEKTVNGMGILIGDATNVLVEHITFQDIPGSAVNIGATTLANNVIVRNNRVIKVSATNYSCENLTTDVAANNAGYGFGVVATNASPLLVEGNTIEDTEFVGIYLSPGCDGARIHNNRLINPENGIRFYSNYVSCVGNTITTPRQDGFRYGISSKGSVIAGNVVSNGAKDGVKIEGGWYGVIANNTFDTLGNRGIYFFGGLVGNGGDMQTGPSTVSVSGATVTGATGTYFTRYCHVGSSFYITDTDETKIVSSVDSDTQVTLTTSASAASGSAWKYQPTSENFTVTGNVINATTVTSIALKERCVNIIVANNIVSNSGYGGIGTVAGTGQPNSALIFGNTYYNNAQADEDFSSDASWTYTYLKPGTITGPLTIRSTTGTPLTVYRSDNFPGIIIEDSDIKWRVESAGNYLNFDNVTNSLSRRLTLHPSSRVTGINGPFTSNPNKLLCIEGMGYGQRTNVHYVTGSQVLDGGGSVSTAVLPDGAIVLGVTVRVTNAEGVTSAAGTAIQIGFTGAPNLNAWGEFSLPWATNSVSTMADFKLTTPVYSRQGTGSSGNLIFTCVGGTFTKGTLRWTVHTMEVVGATSATEEVE